MRRFIFSVVGAIMLSGIACYAETGNQASIADLKEAVYKLIIFSEKYRKPRPQVVYKPLKTDKSYLDKYIQAYVQKNKHFLPKK